MAASQDLESLVLAAARSLGAGSGAQRALALLYDENAATEAIAALIEQEPALTARVLKVANSSFYGQAGRIGSVQRALQVLGTNATRGIAAAACLDRMLGNRVAMAGLDLHALLQHNLAVAQLAQDMARLVEPARATDAYLAGLLHDLGFVILAQLPPEQAARLAHADAATLVFRAWSLPDWLAAAVARHHSIDHGSQDSLARIIAAADQVAAAEGFGFAGEMQDAHAADPEAVCDGLDAGALRGFAAALPDRVRERMAALAL